MKKKNKLIGFALVIIGILSYLGMAIANKLNHKETVKETVSQLHAIAYTAINGDEKIVNRAKLPSVLFFFNSECEHCQAEATLVASNKEKFTNTNVYFFSTEELAKIQEFAKTYKLDAFQVGKVDGKNVAYAMGVNTFPMCFIYAPTGELLQQYKGEVKIEAITKFIQ